MIIGRSKSGLLKALVTASIGLAVGQSGAHALQVTDGHWYAKSLLPARRLVLTYDDGPGANSLAIASYLASYDIPATFFLNGCRFKFMPPPLPLGSPDWGCAPVVDYSFLNTLLALGHRVANHTQDHPYLPDLLPDNPREVARQVRMTHDLLKTVVPDQLYVFRPGSLGWNSSVAAIVRAAVPELIGPFHHEFIAIDHDCLDSHNHEPHVCADRIFDSIITDPVNHGIILLHDRLVFLPEDGGAEQNTFAVTKALVDSLVARGFVFVPIDAIPGVLGPRRFGANCYGSPICVSEGPWTSSFSNAEGWDNDPSYYRSIRLADIDGDGDDDICGRASTGLVCAKSNGSSFGTPKLWTSRFGNADGWGSSKYGPTIQFGDLDGDGDADVCGRGIDGLWCARSSGKQGVESFAYYGLWSDDFSDAEGFGAAASYYGSIRLADVDGNGRADACVRASWGIGCALSNGWSRFHSLTPWLESDFTNADGWLPEQYGSTIMFGDLDGDGRADVCGRASWGISCARSVPRENRFETATEWISARYSNRDEWHTSASKYGSLRMGDVNGDGRADLCGRNDTGMVCVFSDGAHFSGYLHLTHRVADRVGWGLVQYGTTVQLGDVNGDGLADLCGRGSAGVYCWKAAEALRASH
jgi:peptidoglycan/xylan/chitin deacetylase (PgdA/CDA1 family)